MRRFARGLLYSRDSGETTAGNVGKENVVMAKARIVSRTPRKRMKAEVKGAGDHDFLARSAD